MDRKDAAEEAPAKGKLRPEESMRDDHVDRKGAVEETTARKQRRPEEARRIDHVDRNDAAEEAPARKNGDRRMQRVLIMRKEKQ